MHSKGCEVLSGVASEISGVRNQSAGAGVGLRLCDFPTDKTKKISSLQNALEVDSREREPALVTKIEAQL